MKEIELKNLKGTTDFPPEEQALRNKIIDNLKRTFEKYGYMPLETPMLNSFDLLKYKYEDDGSIATNRHYGTGENYWNHKLGKYLKSKRNYK